MDVSEQLDDDELEALEDRVSKLLDDAGDPADDYGDYMHDQKKDRELNNESYTCHQTVLQCHQ